jgi:hypothetical protein
MMHAESTRVSQTSNNDELVAHQPVQVVPAVAEEKARL